MPRPHRGRNQAGGGCTASPASRAQSGGRGLYGLARIAGAIRRAGAVRPRPHRGRNQAGGGCTASPASRAQSGGRGLYGLARIAGAIRRAGAVRARPHRGRNQAGGGCQSIAAMPAAPGASTPVRNTRRGDAGRTGAVVFRMVNFPWAPAADGSFPIEDDDPGH